MSNKLKALGLALLAVFAMSAVAASGAQAAAGSLTAASYPAIITGDQDGGTTKLTVGKEVRVVTCSSTLYDGTITAATASVTVTPTYSGCTAAPGNLPTDVTTHACTYTLTVPNSASNALSAEVTNCPSTAPLEVRITETSGATLCLYKVENQGPLTGSTWANKAGSPEDVTLEINVAPTITVVSGSAVACGAAAGGHPAATLKGNSTVKAFVDNNKVEGAQIGVMIG